MAVAPLFNTSMSTLKAKLRLSGAVDADALAMIDASVQEVRLGLYSRLSSATVTTILVTSLVENPSTDAELTRFKAALVEEKWVRLLLLRKMPVLLMDSSAAVQQAWNQEGIARNMSVTEKAAELSALDAEIQNLLTELSTGSTEDSGIVGSAIGPLTSNTQTPGESIVPGGRRIVFPASGQGVLPL